jgi:hypothetical protein
MRWKIIIVNATILFIVGLLSFVILSAALNDELADPAQGRVAAERAARACNAELARAGLELERWLRGQARTPTVQGVFEGGTADARRERATVVAKEVAALATRALPGSSLSLVLFVDGAGIALGRNDSNQMRGDNMGQEYPSVRDAIASGQTQTDLWLSGRRGEQMLASVAPILGDRGQVVGVLIGATPLSDGLLDRISDTATGQALILGTASETGTVEVIAKGGPGAVGVASALDLVAPSSATRLLQGGTSLRTSGDADEYDIGAAPLAEFPRARAILLAAAPRNRVGVESIVWPLLAVSALGLALVVVGALFLENTISQPVRTLEDGLLAVINGNTELRFELEHPDLGGLVFRINSLLNALTGAPELDDEGRTSQPPEQPYVEP